MNFAPRLSAGESAPSLANWTLAARARPLTVCNINAKILRVFVVKAGQQSVLLSAESAGDLKCPRYSQVRARQRLPEGQGEGLLIPWA